MHYSHVFFVTEYDAVQMGRATASRSILHAVAAVDDGGSGEEEVEQEYIGKYGRCALIVTEEYP